MVDSHHLATVPLGPLAGHEALPCNVFRRMAQPIVLYGPRQARNRPRVRRAN